MSATTPLNPDPAALAATVAQWLSGECSWDDMNEPARVLAIGRAKFGDEEDARDLLARRLPGIAGDLAPSFGSALVPSLDLVDWRAVADVLADGMPPAESKKILADAATRVPVN